jgi:DNA-binding transcriptional LysR family regulator
MPPDNWDDLRYLLAVRRGQTLSAAARQLSVEDTTVSRRLAALQSDLGMQLVQRRGDSRLVLTEAGERVARQAEAMEQHFQSIGGFTGTHGGACAGTVRITAVPILANRLLASASKALLDRHPGLIIELLSDSRDYSLTRREADVAVRLARPLTGGMNLKARRIGTLDYAAHVSTVIPVREVRELCWITYEDTMAHLPQGKRIAALVKSGNGKLSELRVRDAETALEATVGGLGKSLLPTVVADRDARLRRLDLNDGRRLPSREIWLLALADQLGVGRVAAAMSWLEEVLSPRRRHDRSGGYSQGERDGGKVDLLPHAPETELGSGAAFEIGPHKACGHHVLRARRLRRCRAVKPVPTSFGSCSIIPPISHSSPRAHARFNHHRRRIRNRSCGRPPDGRAR